MRTAETTERVMRRSSGCARAGWEPSDHVGVPAFRVADGRVRRAYLNPSVSRVSAVV